MSNPTSGETPLPTCPFCHKPHRHCDSPGAIITGTTGCDLVDKPARERLAGMRGSDGAGGVEAPSKPHVYSLVFEYPGEETQVVGVTDRDDLITKLREDVSDGGEPSNIEGIADQLLRDGVWHDEGGHITLRAHGVCG